MLFGVRVNFNGVIYRLWGSQTYSQRCEAEKSWMERQKGSQQPEHDLCCFNWSSAPTLWSVITQKKRAEDSETEPSRSGHLFRDAFVNQLSICLAWSLGPITLPIIATVLIDYLCRVHGTLLHTTKQLNPTHQKLIKQKALTLLLLLLLPFLLSLLIKKNISEVK